MNVHKTFTYNWVSYDRDMLFAGTITFERNKIFLKLCI